MNSNESFITSKIIIFCSDTAAAGDYCGVYSEIFVFNCLQFVFLSIFV